MNRSQQSHIFHPHFPSLVEVQNLKKTTQVPLESVCPPDGWIDIFDNSHIWLTTTKEFMQARLISWTNLRKSFIIWMSIYIYLDKSSEFLLLDDSITLCTAEYRNGLGSVCCLPLHLQLMPTSRPIRLLSHGVSSVI